ncbi:protein LTO1 homolog [Lutzomyia longipalpis]|uniref:protein LTO1 homolog n=1 Tax=Lutzomyia longipalpis TaxID=7200 RepID=UPI002483F3A9|nr:protein LTO1 homolog [Lutzomyia longipalpis]
MEDHQDINKVFVDIALSEDRAANVGYTEGLHKGFHSGNAEAYHLGYHKGAECGAELGFYSGIAEATILLSREAKVCAAIEALKDGIANLSKVNQPDDANDDDMAIVRGKFHRLCSLLGIKNPFESDNKLAF